jgi:hypothetical protein
MRCDELTDLLAEVADWRVVADGPVADADARNHIESCLRCQADLVQYRKLLRALHNLRTEVLEPTPGLLADILAQVEAAGERHAVRSMLTGKRLAYAGGLAAAATAAGAGAAIILATRGRKLKTAS